MKLGQYSRGEQRFIGTPLGDRVVHLALFAAEIGDELSVPDELRTLIERGVRVDALGTLTSAAADRVEADGGAEHDWLLRTTDVEVLAPLRPRQSIVIATGNIRPAEGVEGGAVPLRYYGVVPTAVTATGGPIAWPRSIATEVSATAALAIVVGKPISFATPVEALNAVFGYSVATCVSAIDLRTRHLQLLKSGSLDTFFPFGPVIVTADEISDPDQLSVHLLLNDELVVKASTADARLGVGELLADLSVGITLRPGDVVVLGGSDDIGFGLQPPRFLRAGDVVESSILGIGSIANPVQPLP